MKKLIFLLIGLLSISFVVAQNNFKYPITVQSKSITGAKIDGYDATKSKVDGAVPGANSFILKSDTNYQKPGGYTSRYDFKYEPTNAELWKMWKKSGADISPLMPTYPIVNVGATALVDGRLYLYRFYTPDSTTVHGFRIIMSASFAGTGDNYNGICLYRYSNDSIYLLGQTTNSTSFWTNTANTSVDKPLASNVTIPPGFYAVAPIYNNSAQTTAPTIEAPYISAIAKSVTFTGGWRTTSYINSVTTPAASYKYTGNVAGESAAPHIILVY